MSEAYERGRVRGQWTMEDVRALGFRSAEKCLARQERFYQEEMRAVAKMRKQGRHAQAAHRADYIDGWITSLRQSLGALSGR